MHDPPDVQNLPERKPDRIIGLSPTKNLQRELSKLDDGNIEETLRSSPFRKGPDPLLFPFLVLEAKSSTSRDGFYQSQFQTAFPIYALLKLQQGLKSRAQVSASEEIPLVWFFANRGEQWLVYACVVSNPEMPEYVRAPLLNLSPGFLEADIALAHNTTLGWLYNGQRQGLATDSYRRLHF